VRKAKGLVKDEEWWRRLRICWNFLLKIIVQSLNLQSRSLNLRQFLVPLRDYRYLLVNFLPFLTISSFSSTVSFLIFSLSAFIYLSFLPKNWPVCPVTDYWPLFSSKTIFGQVCKVYRYHIFCPSSSSSSSSLKCSHTWWKKATAFCLFLFLFCLSFT